MDTCIFNNDSTIEKDGKTVQIQRRRLQLKKNAVPTVFQVQVKSEIDEICNNGSEDNSDEAIDKQVSGGTELYDLSNSQNKILEPPICSVQIENNLESIKEETQDIAYCKESLLRDWKLMEMEQIPLHWGVIDSFTGALFAYTGDDTTSVTRTIFVKNAMTTEVRVHNRIASYPDVNKINSLKDLLEALAVISFLRICQGIGEFLCPNGFYYPVPKSKSLRCKICQLNYRRKQDREKKTEKRTNDRHERNKKFVKNLEAKYKRAKKKIEAQEKVIEDLMSQCTSTRYEALES